MFLSRNMDISYNRTANEWSASIGFFSNKILQDISDVSDEKIANLNPGDELRFGPYKKIPIGENGQFLIKYKGRFNHVSPETRTFKHVSYYDIYRDTVNLDQYNFLNIIAKDLYGKKDSDKILEQIYEEYKTRK